jgi:hypothetical protein
MSSDNSKRTFSIEGSSIGFRGGRYVGLTPVQAAKKAGKALFTRIDNNAHFRRYKKAKVVKFMLRETTKGSVHDEYFYQVKRVEKKEPVVAKINGVDVVYKHDYVTSACERFTHHGDASSGSKASA